MIPVWQSLDSPIYLKWKPNVFLRVKIASRYIKSVQHCTVLIFIW